MLKKDLAPQILKRVDALGIDLRDDGSVPKGDVHVKKPGLAAFLDVSSASLTKYIKSGKLSEKSMMGNRILLGPALVELRDNLDPAQTSSQKHGCFDILAIYAQLVGVSAVVSEPLTPETPETPEKPVETALVVDAADDVDDAPAVDAGGSYNQARTQNLLYRNMRAELELAKESGQYIHIDDHIFWVGQVVSRCLSFMNGCGPKIAQQLASEFGLQQRDISLNVNKIVRREQERFSEQLKKQVNHRKKELT